jgi:RHS repeat-associated protein
MKTRLTRWPVFCILTNEYLSDNNGNMNVGTARTWDVENRLTSITKDSITTTFVYDGDGSRIKKTVGSTTTTYVNQYYEKTGTAATSNYYLGNKMVAQKVGSTLKYLLQDHLGSTSGEVSSSGVSTSTIRYFSFSSVRSGSTSTEIKFTGQRLDSTGLYYYGARYYDPEIGRFISPDTIVPNPANPQTLNRYSYCLNNPLRYIDPTGHDEEDSDDDNMTLDEYMYYIQNGFNTYSQHSEDYGQDAWVDEVFDGIGNGIINAGIGLGRTVLEPGQVLRETWNAIKNYDDTWNALLDKWSTTEGKAELGTEAALGLLLAKYWPKGGKLTETSSGTSYSVDSLINDAIKNGTKLKGGAIQLEIKGDIQNVMKDLTTDATQLKSDLYQCKDGTYIKQYNSSTDGGPSIFIDKGNGIIYKIRVDK